MSGGSYEYLFTKDLVDHYETVTAMAERIAELGGRNSTAALDTYTVLSLMRAVRILAGHLENVWMAVEWYDSCDYGKEQVDEALREYTERVKGEHQE